MSETLLESIRASLKSEASAAQRAGHTHYADACKLLYGANTIESIYHVAHSWAQLSQSPALSEVARYALKVIKAKENELTVSESIALALAKVQRAASPTTVATVTLGTYADLLVWVTPTGLPTVTPLDKQGNVPAHYRPTPPADNTNTLREQVARALAHSLVACA